MGGINQMSGERECELSLGTTYDYIDGWIIRINGYHFYALDQ